MPLPDGVESQIPIDDLRTRGVRTGYGGSTMPFWRNLGRATGEFSRPHHDRHSDTFALSSGHVKGRDFIERVRDIGRDRGVPVHVDTTRGRGSHVTLYYGQRFTIVKDRRKEIAPGLLSAMIRQLGLSRDDFR